MKKIGKLLFLLGFIGVVCVSCKKDEDGQGGIIDVLTASGTIRATVDGQSWVAASQITRMLDGQVLITATALNGDVLNITTFGTESKIYQLQIGGDLGVKTQFTGAFKTQAISENSKNYAFTEGEVVIIEIDEVHNKMSGTFEGTLTATDMSTMFIENGTFTNISFSTSK